LIQNCNKIKKLSATTQELLEAIGASSALEANEAGDSLRRAENKPLPEFKAQKRLRGNDGDAVAVNNQGAATGGSKATLADNEMEPLILFVRDVEGLYKQGKEVEGAIGKKYMIKVPFARFGKSEDGGQLVLDKNNTPAEMVEELLGSGFEFKERVIKFDLGTDRDRDSFLKDHRHHVNNILKRKFKKKLGRPERDVKKKWQGSLEFLGVTYPSLEAFKAKFKGLIMKTKNGDEIAEKGAALLRGLLAHHPKGEQKLEKLKSFTVDFHPQYKTTRCFFLVREDGEKEDFSYHKCVHNYINKLGNDK
jgi:hypothetical protein